MSNESEVAGRLQTLELNQSEMFRGLSQRLEHLENRLTKLISACDKDWKERAHQLKMYDHRLDVQRQMVVEQQNQLNLLEEHYRALHTVVHKTNDRNAGHLAKLESQIEENQQHLDLLDKANLSNVENIQSDQKDLTNWCQDLEDQLKDLHEEHKLLLGALLAFRQLYDENALRAAPLRKRKPTLADRLDGFPTSKPKSRKTVKRGTKKVSTPGKRS